MNFNQLQYFCEISKCGSFTKAAETLHVTQPSLSKAVSSLEEELGCQLFIRKKGGLVLTDSGKVFLAQAQVVLQEMEKLARLGLARSNLCIGIPPTIGFCFIPRIMDKALRLPSMPALVWKEAGTTTLDQWLRQGMIDAAIMPDMVDLTPYDYVPFTTVEEILCVSKDHALAGEKFITCDMIENETFALFSPDYNQNIPFEQLFGGERFCPRKATYTSQLSTVLDLVGMNMAVAILIDEILKHERAKHQIKGIPLSPPFHLDLVLAWNKKRRPAGIRELARIITSEDF